MAKMTLPDNEYAHMSPDDVVALASEMLDQHAMEGVRAMALAIVLRNRIESQEEASRDPTDVALAEMLVEELAGAPEHRIKLCLSALLGKCSQVVRATE